MTLVIDNISELVTNDPALGSGPLGVVTDASVVVDGDTVVAVAPAGAIADERLDAGGRCVLPGFVDSHTHLVFAGDRAEEFTRRMAGEPYDGGGIRVTTDATRTAGRSGLRASLDGRLAEVHRAGTTTVEIKTGYGLSVDSEAELASLASEATPEATFLGAHLVPSEYRGRADEYVELVCGPMLEAVRGRVRWIDVFCETGAFDADQSRAVLEAGRAAGLGLRLHANQLGHGPGVQLGVEMDCASVDQLHLPLRRRHRGSGRQRHRGHVPAGHRLLYPPALPRRPAGHRRRGQGGDRLELQPGLELHHLAVVLHRYGRSRHGHDHRRGRCRGDRWRGGRAGPDRRRADRPRRSGPRDHPRRAQPPSPRLPARRPIDLADPGSRLPTTGSRPPATRLNPLIHKEKT